MTSSLVDSRGANRSKVKNEFQPTRLPDACAPRTRA